MVEVQDGGYRFSRFGVSVCNFFGLRGIWLVYVQPIIRVSVSGRFPACDDDGGIVNPGKLPGNAFPVSVNSDGGRRFCVLLQKAEILNLLCYRDRLFQLLFGKHGVFDIL